MAKGRISHYCRPSAV